MPLENKKIAFLLPRFMEGGVEQSMLRIGCSLQNFKADVTIVTTDKRGSWFSKIAEAGLKSDHISGVDRTVPYLHARKVGKFLKKSQFDVIFTVFERYSQASIGMLPDTTIVIPLLRNDHPDIYSIGLSNHEGWNVAVGNSRRNCEMASKLSNGRPILLIPNGCPSSGRQYSATTDQSTSLAILFVGRMVHESKGIFLLPDIINRCVESGIKCSLTLVGDGPDLKGLLDVFDRHDLSELVTSYGMLSSDKVLERMAEADVLLFPSYYEGLPNVLIESIMQGCVPISNRLPGITDFIIKDNETGFLVEDNNLAQFIDRLNRLQNDRTLLHRMASNGSKDVEARFSIETEANSYVKLLEECFEGQYPLVRSRKNLESINTHLVPLKLLIDRVKSFIKKIRSRV